MNGRLNHLFKQARHDVEELPYWLRGKMKQFTDITVLVDRSGSMANIKEAMETAFDTFIREHRSVPSTKLTLIQFDDVNDQEVVYQCVPIGSAERLNLRPRGNTPLLDAFCTSIDNTGRRYSIMGPDERPDQVLMVVITDGQENASRFNTRRNVFERVTRQRELYKWQFVYLGANQDVFAESQSFGIPWRNAIQYDPYPIFVGATAAALAGNTVAYANRNSSDVKGYTVEQRVKSVGTGEEPVG